MLNGLDHHEALLLILVVWLNFSYVEIRRNWSFCINQLLLCLNFNSRNKIYFLIVTFRWLLILKQESKAKVVVLSRYCSDLLAYIDAWQLVFILIVLDLLNNLLLSMRLLWLSKIIRILLLNQLLKINKVTAALHVKVNWSVYSIPRNRTVFNCWLLFLSLVNLFVIAGLVYHWFLRTWHLWLSLPPCAVMPFKVSEYLRVFRVLLLYYRFVARLSYYIRFESILVYISFVHRIVEI